MRFLPLVALAGLSLGGCSVLQATPTAMSMATTPVGAQTVADARNTIYGIKSLYAAALTVAVAYASQPYCDSAKAPSRPLCKDAAIVIALNDYKNRAKVVIDASEKTVLSTTATTSELTVAVTAAQAAYGAFQHEVDISKGVAQ